MTWKQKMNTGRIVARVARVARAARAPACAQARPLFSGGGSVVARAVPVQLGRRSMSIEGIPEADQKWCARECLADVARVAWLAWLCTR